MGYGTAFGATLAIAAAAAGCASEIGEASRLRGTAGPVTWEVIDVGQLRSIDQRRIRWSYTIVMREQSGSTIQFERVERGTSAPGVTIHNAAVGTTPFQRRLDPHSEIKMAYVDSWGWLRGQQSPFGGTATLSGIKVIRRYFGKDQNGNAITIPLEIILDGSVGKLTKSPEPVGSLPPAKSFNPGDLKSLAGAWQGFYGDGQFEIPLQVTVREDGSFEAGENDPVTNRFRGNLRVADGQILYSQRNDTGTLNLYEIGRRRLLFGQVTGSRSGQPGTPPSTFTYSVRLESEMP